MKTDAEIQQEVEETFARLKGEAGPGIMALLDAYGAAEQVQRQADAYLSGESPVPTSIVTDTTL